MVAAIVVHLMSFLCSLVPQILTDGNPSMSPRPCVDIADAMAIDALVDTMRDLNKLEVV